MERLERIMDTMGLDDRRIAPRSNTFDAEPLTPNTDGIFRCCVLHRGRSVPITVAYSTYLGRCPQFVGIVEANGKDGFALDDAEYAALRRSIRDAWPSIAATIEVERSVA